MCEELKFASGWKAPFEDYAPCPVDDADALNVRNVVLPTVNWLEFPSSAMPQSEAFCDTDVLLNFKLDARMAIAQQEVQNVTNAQVTRLKRF